KPDVPRGLDSKILKDTAANYNLEGDNYDTVHDAFLAAEEEALDEDVIFIGGSNFTVAEAL
ncbi:MAG TPA: hypothetical protein VJ973_12005, partial [Christiangramia sp.]|nr:hypothetical protein [Christiangramia sp.]